MNENVKQLFVLYLCKHGHAMLFFKARGMLQLVDDKVDYSVLLPTGLEEHSFWWHNNPVVLILLHDQGGDTTAAHPPVIPPFWPPA